MKGVSVVIGSVIMVLLVVVLGGAALMYTNSMNVARQQGIEVAGSSCSANPVLRTDVNVDGWVDSDDVDEVIANFCNPNPPGECTQDQLDKYNLDDNNNVDGDDQNIVIGDDGKLSGGHVHVSITNIGTEPVELAKIDIIRTLPTSGAVARVEWDVASLMPGKTTSAEFLCPGEEGASCEFRLSPAVGKSVTATVYCI